MYSPFVLMLPHSKPHPHLYANAEWGMWNWEKCRCGCVVEAKQIAFVCAANIRWTTKRYLFAVGTSKKNMFAMRGVCLTGWAWNKPRFGICSGLSQSLIPRPCSCIDMAILVMLEVSICIDTCRYRKLLIHIKWYRYVIDTKTIVIVLSL